MEEASPEMVRHPPKRQELATGLGGRRMGRNLAGNKATRQGDLPTAITGRCRFTLPVGIIAAGESVPRFDKAKDGPTGSRPKNLR